MKAASGTKLGNYALVREAGRGGMSIVYEAVDTRIGRTVALKVVSPPLGAPFDASDRSIARLEREARAIARLSHPNVVMIHDVGEQDGQHFLVMEFLDGVTLRARMDSGPLSLFEAADILTQVADGLDAIHLQGVVHRDLKPSNVMLLANGRVKLMDFGVCRQSDESTMTQAGTMIGSPAYMAPEQVRGEASKSSDLWALGVLLYEMLARRHPFAGGEILSVLYRAAHEEPPPIPGTSPEVQKVLRHALEKDPAKRYDSAGDFARAFRAAVSDQNAWLRPLQKLFVGAKTGSRIVLSSARAVHPVTAGVALLFIAAGASVPLYLHNGRLASAKTSALESVPTPTPARVVPAKPRALSKATKKATSGKAKAKPAPSPSPADAKWDAAAKKKLQDWYKGSRAL